MPVNLPPGDRRNLWSSGPVWVAGDTPLARYVARPLREFLRVESSASLVLLAATIAALVWVNAGGAASYAHLWHTTLGVDLGHWRFEQSLHHWVNDGLMAVFFFVVGLEIKYELVNGDLRDLRTAALPVVAAIGGMVVPAGLYLAVAGSGGGADGWGIPMATDIAFAIGVLGLLGRRVPSSVRLFLLTLAIVDDVGAIVVIAVFYTGSLHWGWLGLAVGLLVVGVLLRRVRVWAPWIYAVLGLVVWFATLQSGVHATLAGVALGLLAPATPLVRGERVKEYAAAALADNDLDVEEQHRLRFLLAESVPVVERWQYLLHPVSAYVVLPVFALANAGVDLRGGVLGDALSSRVGIGVAVGLVLGKPLGILLASVLAVRLGVARLPAGARWAHVAGVGAVAGIGFTVSLFIAGLSFPDAALMTDEAKVGILVASLLAAAIGALCLSRVPEVSAGE